MSHVDAELDGDEARRRLYDVMRSDDPFDERAERALEIGRQYLGVQNGHVAAIDREDDRWEAIVSTDEADDDFPPGLALNLRTTYCRRVIGRDNPVALHDVPENGWEDDVAFETHGLHCYHGTVIRVDGELFGTVCFVDEDSREAPFSEGETMFAELVARMLGYALEERRHEARLAESDRELREQRAWLRSIVDATTDLVFRIDPDGEFTFVSEHAEDLLGFGPEDLVGKSVSFVVPEGEPLDRATDAFHTVAGGEPVELSDHRLEDADGEQVYVDVYIAPVYAADESGHIVAQQGIIRDVTERRRQRRLVGILHRLLRHNLRNDMNVVRGLAEGILDRADDAVADLAGEILSSTDGLVELSGKARKLERYVEEEPTPRPLDVVPHVERAVEDVADDYPGADVATDLPADAVARAAPAIETAVHEVVENAVKHAEQAPTVDVEVSRPDGGAEVVVTDDGPGLPEQDRTVLRKGDQSPLHHGSGLGLWLVYWILESIDGDVDATVSERGTTVVFRLDEPADRNRPRSEPG